MNSSLSSSNSGATRPKLLPSLIASYMYECMFVGWREWALLPKLLTVLFYLLWRQHHSRCLSIDRLVLLYNHSSHNTTLIIKSAHHGDIRHTLLPPFDLAYTSFTWKLPTQNSCLNVYKSSGSAMINSLECINHKEACEDDECWMRRCQLLKIGTITIQKLVIVLFTLSMNQ